MPNIIWDEAVAQPFPDVQFINAVNNVRKSVPKKAYVEDHKNMTPQTIGKQFGLRSPQAIRNKDNEFNYFGVEIELEHCVGINDGVIVNQDNGVVYWVIKPDGSLRNNGIEFISQPATLEKLPEVFQTLNKFMAEHVPNAVANFRCGLHVHANIQHLTGDDYKSILLWYLAVEDILFDLSGQRDSNHFCVPMKNSVFIQNNFNKFANIHKPDYLSSFVGRCTKYMALNLRPTTNLGTIEFRHHHGTKDLDVIYNWVKVISNLMVMSKELGIDNLLNINTVSNYMQILEKLFVGTQYEVKPQYEKVLRIGVRYVKRLMWEYS